jgi:benzil reductase ((S)-benzoin forming)
MKKILIITGASRGLGKAIANLALKDKDTFVISLSRSRTGEEEPDSNTRSNYSFLETDLSESVSDKIIEAVREQLTNDSVIYFFNNAAVILPIDKIGNFRSEAIGYSLKVNIEYPVNLINKLMGAFIENKIVWVNISSGAAKNSIAHWALYCSSKAYMQMFFDVLSMENRENPKLEVYSLNPGVMDTRMQEEIRSHVFPKQDYFNMLKSENGLSQPGDVAKDILGKINFYS